MKITTTIYEILESEFRKAGMNEFFDCKTDTIDLTGKSLSFMFAIQDYTNPKVIAVVNESLFGNVKLSDTKFDNYFKRAYINRFLDRQIMFQTLDLYRSKNISYFLTQKEFLDKLFADLDKYLQSNTTGKSNNVHKYRSAFQDLPQSQVNLMLDSDVMYTATNNTVTNQSNETNSDSGQFNLDTLLKYRQIMEQILNEFDRKCFMQIY